MKLIPTYPNTEYTFKVINLFPHIKITPHLYLIRRHGYKHRKFDFWHFARIKK